VSTPEPGHSLPSTQQELSSDEDARKPLSQAEFETKKQKLLASD
jgi:hypothetical protein